MGEVMYNVMVYGRAVLKSQRFDEIYFVVKRNKEEGVFEVLEKGSPKVLLTISVHASYAAICQTICTFVKTYPIASDDVLTIS